MKNIIVMMVAIILISCGGSKKVTKSEVRVDSTITINTNKEVSTSKETAEYVGKTVETDDNTVFVFQTDTAWKHDTTYVKINPDRSVEARGLKTVTINSKVKEVDTSKYLTKINQLTKENNDLKSKLSTKTEAKDVKKTRSWWLLWIAVGILLGEGYRRRKQIISSIKQVI